jgi:hypothetical protein
MIRKSGCRFSEKIMLEQQAEAKYRVNLKSFRFIPHLCRARFGKEQSAALIAGPAVDPSAMLARDLTFMR